VLALSAPAGSALRAEQVGELLVTIVRKYRSHTANQQVTALRAGRSRSGDKSQVKTSFEFLLEREPASPILRTFGLDVISRYFPDYPAEIRARLGDDPGTFH
jgi:hypothetical protein